MWVQEIEFDIDKGECLSESGFNEVKDVPVAQLRFAAEQEFGEYHGDLFDPEDETKRIGWKFRAKAKYQDPEYGEEFNLETWVVLHSDPPKMEFSYYTIQDHDLEAIEKIDTLLGIKGTGTSDDQVNTSTDGAMHTSLEDAVEALIKEEESKEPETLDAEDVT